ncbi:DUF2624 domain-containing protein [Mesobacillus maritimus]|uniref:DUF2624 domain-containing protein n=1 Tax=Mesobacillus maritimus TaxID=1643336 RepID=UPI00203DE387|nr:DUF2624 domain-containing protein [Mesobacillus maritimus]MCM3671707.1 DUF2624 domain-containing protein [Mesobacillus maritimus]
MKIFENIVNHKVNNITGEELLKYAEPFKLSISRAQADKIAKYLRGQKVNIFDDRERAKLIKEIAKVAGPETAKEVNKLFLLFTKDKK